MAEPQTSSTIPVLIVGAGPTGLVLALWLTKLGVAVRIIDKTAEPGTTSRAIGVQARTLEFYRQIDLATAVIAAGVKVAGLNLWVKGAKVARVPFARIGEGLSPFPFVLMYPQDDHERLLIERLDALGAKVERQTELIAFEQEPSAVRASIKRPGGAEETCTATFLAGCDGAHSLVRETLKTGFPGGTYSRMFYVADVEASGEATDHELHVDIDQADFLAVFPMQGEGRARLIGTVRDDSVRPDHALTFDDVGNRALGQLKLDVKKVNWFSTYHVHHRVTEHFRKGRAFLLGDAAHIHSPVGAQGMNTGIGDAINLAWKLAAVLGGVAPDRLLDTYEAERIGFAQRLVATTDRAFTLVTSEGPIAKRVRTVIFPALAPLLIRSASLRRLLFRTASQIGIQYRGSPLSVGCAGTVCGGDRLPWVDLGTERDNFEPLALDWQIHVYGEAGVGLDKACAELKVPLHVFEWTDSMNRCGLMPGAVYLIRPDGYVALADPDGDAAGIQRYFNERGFRRVA